MFWLSQLASSSVREGSGFSRDQWSLSRPVGCSVFGASRGRGMERAGIVFVCCEDKDRRSAS